MCQYVLTLAPVAALQHVQGHFDTRHFMLCEQPYAPNSAAMNLQDFGSTDHPSSAIIPEQLSMIVEVCLCILCWLLLMLVLVLKDLAKGINQTNEKISSICSSSLGQQGQVTEIRLLLQRLKDIVVNMKVQLDILIEPRIAQAELELIPSRGSCRNTVPP